MQVSSMIIELFKFQVCISHVTAANTTYFCSWHNMDIISRANIVLPPAIFGIRLFQIYITESRMIWYIL